MVMKPAWSGFFIAYLQCKRKPAMRSEVVTITTMVSQYSGSTCLPDVALYSAGHRRSKSVTAR
ncbi:transcriptional antitermination N peptide [Pseudocitrobacter corydidari]